MLTDLLWQKASEVLYISKEQFIGELGGWHIEPVIIDGELAFITLTKGPLFHFHSQGTQRAISMRMIREFVQKLIDEHGYAETRTPKDDTRQHRFNLRFGFVATGEDEFDVHYRIEKLRHV